MGLLEGPPIPHCNWRTLPSSQTPSLPALSFPLPPTPLGSFCKAPGGGGPGWWGGRVLGRKGVAGGGGLQAALGARPTSGGTRYEACRIPAVEISHETMRGSRGAKSRELSGGIVKR